MFCIRLCCNLFVCCVMSVVLCVELCCVWRVANCVELCVLGLLCVLLFYVCCIVLCVLHFVGYVVCDRIGNGRG